MNVFGDAIGVILEETSLAFTWGLPIGKWIKQAAPAVGGWIKKGIVAAKQMVKNIIAGGAAVIESIRTGNFFKLIGDWISDDPLSATAGIIAVALVGLLVVGLVAGWVAGLIAAIGVAGGLSTAALLAVIAPSVVRTGQMIVNFDFGKSDAALEKELLTAFENLAGVAGESLGRALAGMVLGRTAAPKLTINMKAVATLWLILEEEGRTDVHEEILEALSQLGWAMVRYGRRLLFTQMWIKIRQFARENVRTGNKKFDDWISQWGLREGESLIIARAISQTVEKIEEKNKVAGQFLENFLEGLGEGIQEFIVLEYGR